jgi:hypothetical protein
LRTRTQAREDGTELVLSSGCDFRNKVVILQKAKTSFCDTNQEVLVGLKQAENPLDRKYSHSRSCSIVQVLQA